MFYLLFPFFLFLLPLSPSFFVILLISLFSLHFYIFLFFRAFLLYFFICFIFVLPLFLPFPLLVHLCFFLYFGLSTHSTESVHKR
jgi:hypothetical protein